MTQTDDTKKGYFIVLDGADGAGKSTQIRALKTRLEAVGYTVTATREPGGSAGAEEVRKLLLNGTDSRWDGISELLLFSAARRNHVNTLIKPAMQNGHIVLCDRFVPCTIAYQGFGRKLSLDVIEHVTKISIGSFEADLTFLFFIDPELGLNRSQRRLNNTETRFESLHLDFHHRTQEGYQHVMRVGNFNVPATMRKYLPVSITEDNTITTQEQIDQIADRLFAAICGRINRERPWLLGHNEAVQHDA